MISACAVFSLHFIPSLSPFPPSSDAPLSYRPPHSVIIPSSHPLPSFRSSSLSPRPSFFPSSPVFLLVCPSLVCVSLSLLSTFPLFLLEIFPPPRCLPHHQFCLSLSPLLSLACRSVSPPFDTRRSLFARVTHRRGETIRRFPGWHLVSRAAFFLSISLSLSLVCFHHRSRCYR